MTEEIFVSIITYITYTYAPHKSLDLCVGYDTDRVLRPKQVVSLGGATLQALDLEV